MMLVGQYGSLRCLISVPSTHASSATLWPLLCFLHGKGEAAPLDIEVALTRHGPLSPASAQEATDHFVIVAPQLPLPGGDVWRSNVREVQQVVDGAALEYRGDPARLYLTGFSYGGNGVLDLAPLMRPVWAALWAVDPPRVPQGSAGRPVWLSAGPYARSQRETFARALGVRDLSGAPTGDYVYRDADLGHVETARQAYADSAPYQWLLDRSLG